MHSVHDKIDKIFKEVGEFGPYQLIIILICGASGVIPAMNAYSAVFIAAVPDYRCVLPGWENNDTYEIQDEYHYNLVEKYILPAKDVFSGKYDGCMIKKFSGSTMNSNFTVETCNQWVFSEEFYGNSMVTKWDLVCEKSKKDDLAIYNSLYFVGTFLSFLTGTASDRFGRKTLCVTLIAAGTFFNIVLSLLLNLVNNYGVIRIVFIVSRVFLGICTGVYSVGSVLNIEVCGPSKRVTAVNVIHYSFVFGLLLTVGIAYFLRNFDTLSIVYTSIMTLFLICFWFVPESPRWLMIKNKTSKAYRIFKRIASSNKRTSLNELESIKPLNEHKKIKLNEVMPMETISSHIDKQLEVKRDELVPNTGSEENSDETPKTLSYGDTIKIFFKSRKIMIVTSVLMLNWITNTLVYYGISFHTDRLAGDPYLNFFLSSVAEALSYVACEFTLEKFGRKWPYSMNMALAGVSLLCVAFVPDSLAWLVTVLALIAKFGISFTFNTVYIVTAEMYPTSIRNSIVSICSGLSSVGGIVSPYVQQLGDDYWYPLPYIIFGAFAASSALAFMVAIGETKGKKMPDSIDEF